MLQPVRLLTNHLQVVEGPMNLSLVELAGHVLLVIILMVDQVVICRLSVELLYHLHL